MSIGAGAIRAGLAVVELGMDLGPLDAALNQAAGRLKGWGGKLAKFGAGVAGVGLSIAGPILAAFKGAVDQAASMGTLATQLGMTAEKASALAYALGTVGIEEGEIVQFTRHMNSAFAAAADGSHEAVQGFAKLGLNWQELAKMPLDERLLAVKDALGQITNDFDRSTQAAHYFGRRGQELLKLSSAELRGRMGEASDVGAVVSPEQVAQAKEVQRSFMQIGAAMKYAFVEVGRALLPHHETIKEYARTVVNVAKGARELVTANKPLVLGVLGLGVAVTAAGAALVVLGVIGASVAGILSGVAAAGAVVFSPAVIGALGAFSMVAPFIAAGAAAAYLFYTRTEAGKGAIESMGRKFAPMAAEGKRAWGVIKESALASWGGIKSALGRGDLKSAWAVVVAGADVAWVQVKGSFLNVWGETRDEFLLAWQTVIVGLQMMFDDLAQSVGEQFGRIFRGIGRMALLIGDTAAAKLAGRSEVLKNLGGALVGGADRIGGTDADRERRQRKAREALVAAEAERQRARGLDRQRREIAVAEARARLKAILDEESRAAALAGRKVGQAGDSGGFGSLQQAAREVRGTFGVGFTGSASAQQALGVGSTPVQRQLIEAQKQTGLLQQIRDKVEGPPTW